MTIFDVLNSILYSKKRLDINLEDENIIGGPFMLNRWISMYNGDLAIFINNFFNKSLPFESKESYYNFYFNLCPKLRFKKIAYIKKTKKEDEKDSIPKREFLSQREMELYVDLVK